MKRLRKIYISSLLGALGGLVASLLHQYLLLDLLAQPQALFDRLLYLALLGGLLGVTIGLVPNFSERLSNSSFSQALHSGLIGAFWGGLGGLLALPLAEILHGLLGGGYKGRPIAFALFGLALGIAEGFNGGSRLAHGILGGILGGLAAGAILEFLLADVQLPDISGLAALITVGAAMAFSIALVLTMLANARLEALKGSPFSGHIFYLGRFRDPHEAILGSDKTKSVFIHIKDAERQHAAISLTEAGARIRHLADTGDTYVNGNLIREAILNDSDIITIGCMSLVYKERGGAAFSATRLKHAHKVSG